MGNEHVNLMDKVKRFRDDKIYMIPPHSIFVANGKDGTKRIIPLNSTAERIFIISELLGHSTPVSGFASRITPGYRAVDSLQYLPVESVFEQKSSK